MSHMDKIEATREENPFTDILGPELELGELLDALEVLPDFDPEERTHRGAQRKFYATRLFDFFIPTFEQLKFAETLHNSIKRGYSGRDPRTTNYVRGLLDHAENKGLTLEERCSLPPARSTGRSHAVTGQSGMGKTVAADRILRRYVQARQIQCGATISQVVWLKIETPKFASLKQLCLEFFSKLDQVLGTTYEQWYSGLAADAMISKMSHCCRLHAIGVLVIDEIQHLLDNSKKSLELRNFVTKLVNQLEIPIVMIGTQKALGIFNESLVQARRASGSGSLVFQKAPQDEAWREFVETMWSYQWTKAFTPLTDEMADTLYKHCQGVTDILIILYVLTQQTAIDEARTREDDDETITPELIELVASRYLSLVQAKMQQLAQGIDDEELEISEANRKIRDDLMQNAEDELERRRSLAAERAARKALPYTTASGEADSKQRRKRGRKKTDAETKFDPPQSWQDI